MSELTVRERLEVAAAFDMVIDVDPHLVIQALDALDAAADLAMAEKEAARKIRFMAKVYFACGLATFIIGLVAL